MHEMEVLQYASKAFVLVLWLCISVLQSGLDGRFEAWDLAVGACVFAMDYLRLHIVKRMQYFRKENNQRTYFTPMIVISGLVSLALDLVLWNRFLSGFQAIGCLLFLLGLLNLHWFELGRLFYWTRANAVEPKEEPLAKTA